MEPEKGPVATEPPPLPSVSPVNQEAVAALAADATRTLKRQREATPTSPESAAATAQPDPSLSPSKAARLMGLTSRHSPAPLTGAAALEDERRKKEEEYKQQVSGNSENPAFKVQSQLMTGDSTAVSRPQDAPAQSDAQPEPQPTDAPTVSIPTTAPPAQADPKADVSPQSAESVATLGNGSAPVTNSPTSMDIDGRSDREGFGTQPPAQMEEKSGGTSLSYPGMLQAAPSMPAPAPPVRGMSMPMTPNQTNTQPKSPSSKKHKCPYCETEFTRHHNLKSHLLTHSQEKPYVCQTCNMRFRRLHDLKRHSKLHTGEKPHICPKCDRKFARGDALARHSKGAGGCVGRRSSMGGSFLGEDDMEGNSHMEGNDSTMTDVFQEGSNDVDMAEQDRRRLSMSGVKAHGSNVSLPIAGGNPSVFAQSGMTESPKPLSPGAQGQDANRQRSPGLTQFAQHNFGRQPSDRNTSPGFNAVDAARYAAQAAGHVNAAASQSGTFSDGIPQTGSGDSSSNNIFATDQGIWTYVHTLEDQVKQLLERVQSIESSEKARDEREKAQGERIMVLENELSAYQSQREAKPAEPLEEPQIVRTDQDDQAAANELAERVQQID